MLMLQWMLEIVKVDGVQVRKPTYRWQRRAAHKHVTGGDAGDVCCTHDARQKLVARLLCMAHGGSLALRCSKRHHAQQGSWHL